MTERSNASANAARSKTPEGTAERDTPAVKRPRKQLTSDRLARTRGEGLTSVTNMVVV